MRQPFGLETSSIGTSLKKLPKEHGPLGWIGILNMASYLIPWKYYARKIVKTLTIEFKIIFPTMNYEANRTSQLMCQ
jgi:hypothetical protein